MKACRLGRSSAPARRTATRCIEATATWLRQEMSIPTPSAQAIVALIVAVPGAQPSASELVAQCRQQLSGYKVPDEIRFAEALPLTPTGKLMRRELRALAEAGGGQDNDERQLT